MASDIDIVNLSLSHLGETSSVVSINPPEGSSQAIHAARFYPIARDALLQPYPWNFNTRRVAPAAITSQTTSYAFAYQIPNDALNIFSVLPPDTTDDYVGSLNPVPPPPVLQTELNTVSSGKLPVNYAREVLDNGQDVIYTDVENAVIRYGIRITDAGKFPPLFVLALARLLAVYLCGPIIKGKRGREEAKSQYQMFLVELSQARESDANQEQQELPYKARWMVDR